MSKKIKHGVIVGRFQPIHNGHVKFINEVLEKVEKLTIFVGSANISGSLKNPFTFNRRKEFINACRVVND